MGCSEVQTIEIGEVGPIVTVLENEYYLCGGEPLILDVTQTGTAADSVSYLWSDGSQLPILEVLEAGQYWVEIVNICEEQKIEFNVLIDDESPASRIYVPNGVYAEWRRGE